jgi:hypothetical protein
MTARRWALWLTVLSITTQFGLIVMWLFNLNEPWTRLPIDPPWNYVSNAISMLALVVCAVIGMVIARSHPRNFVGWILLTFPLSTNVAKALTLYSDYVSLTPSSSIARLRGFVSPEVASWIAEGTYRTALALFGTVLFLVFPNGRLPSRRWRPFLWGTLALVTVNLVMILFSGRVVGISNIRSMPNPFQVAFLGFLDYSLQIGRRSLPLDSLIVWLLYLPAAGALIHRLITSKSEERQQIKWVGAAASFFAFSVAAYLAVYLLGERLVWEVPIPDLSLSIGFLLVPLACAVAVFRYRLYDIDVVLNKAVLFGALAILVTAGYSGISLVAARIGAGNVSSFVRVVAIASIALVFAPVRDSTQRLADRLVYGKRLDGYEALNAFNRRIAANISSSEALPAVAQAALSGCRARQVRASLLLGDGTEKVSLAPAGEDLRDEPNIEIAIMFSGHQIGGLQLWKQKGEPVRALDMKLLNQLAAHAAPAFQNVRLTEELRAKVKELNEVRAELTAARPRLINSGTQVRRTTEAKVRNRVLPYLDAVKESLSKGGAGAEPKRTLDEAAAHTDTALTELRNIAHGLFPQMLVERGLVAALESHRAARTGAAHIKAQPEFRSRRFDPIVEQTAYACAAEVMEVALPVEIELSASETLAVVIEGRGNDLLEAIPGDVLRNLSDRLIALDGRFRISLVQEGNWVFEATIPLALAENLRAS